MTLLKCSRNIKQLCKHINIDLRPLIHRLYANKILLNASKTEYVIFKSPRKHYDFVPKIKIAGKKLYPSKFIKYLGIHIDEHLNWSKHVETVANKVELRHYLLKSTLVSVYYSIFTLT